MRVIPQEQFITRDILELQKWRLEKGKKGTWGGGYNIAQNNFFSRNGFSEEGTGVTRGSSLA